MGEKGGFLGLDILKTLCAFLVIVIHSLLPIATDTYTQPITRNAVPCFFMISGFFYSESKKRGGKKQIVKILKLILISVPFYILYDLARALLANVSAEEFSKFIKNKFINKERIL